MGCLSAGVDGLVDLGEGPRNDGETGSMANVPDSLRHGGERLPMGIVRVLELVHVVGDADQGLGPDLPGHEVEDPLVDRGQVIAGAAPLDAELEGAVVVDEPSVGGSAPTTPDRPW